MIRIIHDQGGVRINLDAANELLDAHQLRIDLKTENSEIEVGLHGIRNIVESQDRYWELSRSTTPPRVLDVVSIPRGHDVAVLGEILERVEQGEFGRPLTAFTPGAWMLEDG